MAADTDRPTDFPQPVLDLYNDYAHGRLSRRDFVNRLGGYTVAGASGAALAGLLMPRYADAQQVPADDERLVSERVTYDSPEGAGQMGGLLVRPAGVQQALPAILVVHENRGLNPHIEDVARRAALEGYTVLAPDALYPLGGYPGTDDEGRELQKQRTREEMLADFVAGAQFVQEHELSNGKLGVVGFCFGGMITNLLAVTLTELDAAVPFYGGWPDVADAEKVACPLMIHMAEHDGWVNEGWPAYKAALDAAGKGYEAFVYPGTSHGFHNDTTPRFDPQAAELAWSRTTAFFASHLK